MSTHNVASFLSLLWFLSIDKIDSERFYGTKAG